MAKIGLLLLCYFLIASSSRAEGHDYLKQFEAFELQFGKTYKDASERQARYSIFVENVREIEEHNREKGHSWSKSINGFADMTKDEFSKRVNRYKVTSNPTLQQSSVKSRNYINVTDLPVAVDWRDKGAISDMKDQGGCGSCWAIAAIEQIESYLQIKSGKSIQPLSVEHVVACTPNPLVCGGGGGCEGAVTQLGYSYVQLFGLATEEEYPYTSGDYIYGTDECKYRPNDMDVTATVRGYEVLPRNDYESVMYHLANVGPLSVAVASGDWNFYHDGVFDACSYDYNIEINHAVQLVGYGTDPEQGDYWIIRNSWGDWWGQAGYMKLKREANPPCGTNYTPLAGSGCVDDGQEQVTVCGQCGVLFDALYPIGSDYIE